MSLAMHLDAHQKPGVHLKSLYKRYQKVSPNELAEDANVVDFTRGLTAQQEEIFDVRPFDTRSSNTNATSPNSSKATYGRSTLAYTCKSLSGLTVIPSLLSICDQRDILQKLLHRDLSNPKHLTNVHFHHNLVYPAKEGSFFDYDPEDTEKLQPKSAEHKAISMRKFFNRSLRWVTLGGQYDWTKKLYPDKAPPPFPPDIQAMLHQFFPQTIAEAAIVNFYSPGDVLSLHRDVAEYCDKGLISLSIGCDALFMIALDQSNDHEAESLMIRLRSGDAVYMDGRSRYAWHGVPAVLGDTCPPELQRFPASEESDEADAKSQWKYWMRSKRVNLNVRQMWADNDRPYSTMPPSSSS